MSTATPTKEASSSSRSAAATSPAASAAQQATGGDTTTPAGAQSPDASSVKSPRTQKAPKLAGVAAGAASSPTPAAASSASPVDGAAAAAGKRERQPKTPLSAEEQAARAAANKLRPCFDLAEKKACEKGDACQFSHDPAVLATAPEARKADEARKVEREAEAEKRKAERAAEREASRPEREAKSAAAKAEREAKQEAAKAEKAKKQAERQAAGGSPAAASSSPADGAAKRERKPRTPLSAEEQAARDAANKLRPCFDLAEKKTCEKGDACPFSHDPKVLETAPEARKADEARRAERDAERKASRPEREAKAAAAKAERDAKQEAAKAEKAKKATEKPAAAAPAAKTNGTPAPVAVSSPNDAKQPREKKAKEAKKPATPAASPATPAASPVPAVLATGAASSAIDLSHIIVRNAITARHPSHQPGERAKISARLMKKPFVIGMTGGTASGKTTVCNEFCERIGTHRVAVLQMDRFYFSLPHNKPAEEHNFDDPSAFDWDYFNSTLEKLSTGATVQVPQYSFETHQRLEKLDTFYPAEVILVEGILTLHDERIRKQFDLKVFIEADSDVRLARRIQRDIEERARTVDGVIHQYISTVKPSHDKYIQPSARYADIIVPHNGPKNGIAIDLLAQHVSTEIYKRGANLATKPTKAQLQAAKGKKDGGQVLAASAAPPAAAAAASAPSPTKPTRGPQMASRAAPRAQ